MEKKLSKIEQLQADVIRLAAAAKLDHWTSFIRTLVVPADLAPALMSNRLELLKLATPRPLSRDECELLYKLIAGLMETNAALREHSEHLAQLVHNWSNAFLTLSSVGKQIDLYANYRHGDVADEEET